MDERVQKKLQALFVSYTKNLPDKIQNIENQHQELIQHWDQNQFKVLHRDVHSLCGSSGTYGYLDLSKAARLLEIYLKTLLDNVSITKEQQEKIANLLSQLKLTLILPPPEPFPNLALTPQVQAENRLVFIIEEDEKLVQELTDCIIQADYKAHRILDIQTLEAAIQEQNPIAIIVDTIYLDKIDTQLLLEILKKQETPIKLLSIVPNAELLPRLQAIRAGSVALFQKPVDALSVTKVLSQLCDLSIGESYRILIVDDSESLAEYYSLILNQAGMIAHSISNPLKLLEALEEFQPDLLLMDIYMPQCTGLELATVLRHEDIYTKLPIIFLSTEGDKNKKLLALSLGGDDYLTKPILPQHLISAVRTRAKRAGVLNFYMSTDSLTGLLNHSSILKHLEIELEHAKQKNSPLSFIMIDIDHFKVINDTFGHPLGDAVIKKLSALLSTRLRHQDIVGRYGGEEFAIILPDIHIEESKKICDDLRNQFSQYCFSSGNAEFYISFSAGIACFPMEDNARSLVESADQALYKAKHAGRNQVFLNEKNT